MRAATPEPRCSPSALRRARRLDSSARAALAGWLGDPKVRGLVAYFRPDIQTLLEPFGFTGEIKIVSAAGVLLGLTGVTLNGSEWRNPFLGWSPERLTEGGLVALRLRHVLAVMVERLCIEGVALQAVENDPHYSDERGFSADHLALLVVLWLDIPLEGRTGAEIAAELPALATVGWYRDDGGITTSDHAHERDVRDVFALQRVWREKHGRPPIRKPYARGGKRRKPHKERIRDQRRTALAAVTRRYPDLTAGQLLATWGRDATTPGGLLRTKLELEPWDKPPSESTLRLDLRALNR